MKELVGKGKPDVGIAVGTWTTTSILSVGPADGFFAAAVHVDVDKCRVFTIVLGATLNSENWIAVVVIRFARPNADM
jgi:hypothetical protein